LVYTQQKPNKTGELIMKLEHVALNVPDPIAMADWYRENLGMTVMRRLEEAPFTHFIRDSGGKMMLEIYKNPPDQVPDYATIDPLILHFAFVSENPAEDKSKLLEAGASLVKEEQLDGGSHIVMLRDPWGVPIQLCKRGIKQNMLSN